MRLIDEKLEKLKKELDLLVENGASKSEIYEMSIKIDKMLVEDYKIHELGQIIK